MQEDCDLETDIAALGMPKSYGKEEFMLDTNSIVVRVVAGVLAVIVMGIIIYRRKQKSA
jgi:hypothetical protein